MMIMVMMMSMEMIMMMVMRMMMVVILQYQYQETIGHVVMIVGWRIYNNPDLTISDHVHIATNAIVGSINLLDPLYFF